MWIIVAITGYFFLAISDTVDKYLLSGPIPNPKVYAFFVGMLGAVTFLLIPFGVLEFPGIHIVVLALIAGMMRVLGLLAFFTGLGKFEVSRIVPALGGVLPIFTLFFVFLLTGEKEVLSFENFPAFLFLVGGSIGITIERKTFVTVKSLLYAALIAFLFAIFFVFSKFVYEAQPFLSGLVWIAFGSVFGSFVFLGSKEVRESVKSMLMKKKTHQTMSKRTRALFVGNQMVGGGAILLQSLAVALIPFGLLPFVNALEGVTYFFVFVITFFLSLKFPAILKENISTKVVLQKLLSIVLIGIGLLLLAL